MSDLVGLDISPVSIRVVQLSKLRDGYEVVTYGRVNSPVSTEVFGTEEEKEELVKYINILLKESKVTTNNASFSLPDSRTYTQVIKTPSLTDKELSAAMKWQAEQYIPLPLEEVAYDYKIVRKKEKEKQMLVLLSAVPKYIIEKYTELSKEIKLRINSAEPEIICAARIAAQQLSQEEVAAVICLEEFATSFAFVSADELLFVHTLSLGGRGFTRSIGQTLGLNEEQAERYKYAYGMDKGQLDGKVYTALEPLLEQFVKELNKGFVFFKESFPEAKIDLVYLSGSGAKIPGTVRFLTERFGIETQRLNPFAGLKLGKGVNAPTALAPELTVATGLAMRE